MCILFTTRQNNILPSANFVAHGKDFTKFLILPSKIFVTSTHFTLYSMLSFSMFLALFVIFNHFILLNDFLADESNLNCKCFE